MIMKREVNPILIDLSFTRTIPFNNINIALKMNTSHPQNIYFSFGNEIIFVKQWEIRKLA